MDVIELSETIFNDIPKPANSIQLDFSENNGLTTKDIFEILLTLFQRGMIIHYGDEKGRVDLTKVSDSDFDKMNEYFNSFNFSVYYSVKPIDHVEENIEKKVLRDYYLRIRTNYLAYYIWFDNYVADTNCKDI